MLGTSAMMTCMAMDAAMMGPMPTWKKGMPLPRMALSPQPRPVDAATGTMELTNWLNTFPPTCAPAGVAKYFIGNSEHRRMSTM
jgi:hypothetical protein